MKTAPACLLNPRLLPCAALSDFTGRSRRRLASRPWNRWTGDWMPTAAIANYPDVHNFNQMCIVGPDLTSCLLQSRRLVWPGEGIALPVDRRLPPGHDDDRRRANFRRPEMRWSAYQALRRNPDCHGLAVETDTRMVNEQRGVLCRITVTNGAAKPASAAIILRVPGALQPDGVGVANGTQRKNVVSVVRPARKPDTVTTEPDAVCWKWTLDLPAGGRATLGYVAGDEKPAEAVQTDARVAGWAAHFDATMEECQRVWEQRWADAFTPGNTHFSGNLPVLKSDHPALDRNYYMGALTSLILERTQFPVTPRDFITSGERGDGIQYYWDASMEATAWALLEPRGMKATLRRWLVQNARSGAHTSPRTRPPASTRSITTWITGYAFNACTIFKAADAYRAHHRRPRLSRRKAGGRQDGAGSDLDSFATDWETLPRGPHGLG